MDKQNCFGCGKKLDSGENKKRRRLLSSSNLSSHLKTLSSLAMAADSAIDIDKLNAGYICRTCVGLMDKYQELHKQLSNNFFGAIPHLPKLHAPFGSTDQSTSTSHSLSRYSETSQHGQEFASISTYTEKESQTLCAESTSQSLSLDTDSQSKSPAMTVSYYSSLRLLFFQQIILIIGKNSLYKAGKSICCYSKQEENLQAFSEEELHVLCSSMCEKQPNHQTCSHKCCRTSSLQWSSCPLLWWLQFHYEGQISKLHSRFQESDNFNTWWT